MNKFVRASVYSALFCLSASAIAVNSSSEAVDIPSLVQESQHSASAKRISSHLLRSHYKPIKIDDNLSAKTFDRYVRTLDFNRNFFLKSDIEAMEKYRLNFDEAIAQGNLNDAYSIYSLNLTRRLERFEYAITLLDKPFDFEKKGDSLEFDREDAPWAASTAEINELWRQRVKYDALNLKLAGKTAEEIKDLLTKRYERAIKRLSQTKSEDVFQTVMHSFARSVDAHTSYLSPQSTDRFDMEMNLSFEGIGAVLQSEDDYTVIRSVVPGGPAELSKKIKPEDKIVGVAQGKDDFVDIIGWRLDEVVDLIKGPKGSVVKLQVLKGASESNVPEVVSLTRDKIKLEDRAAKSEVYIPEKGTHAGEKLGVITIPSFYNNLHTDVKKELADLKEKGVRGIVVDLRGNGGGSLTEATLLSGLFFDQGPVVQIHDASGRTRTEKDTDGITYYDGPLTVLVDRYSASASEIFAAAMQDYGRAVVLGEQTFGKGTVQRHRPLGRIYDLYSNPLGSIQYTIAKFYRINGGSTQNLGVVPDIKFPSAIDPDDWGESQEENALPWDSIERVNYSTFSDTSSALTVMEQNHLKRIKNDPEFAYIFEDIQRYQKEKDKKTISLVESERIKEKEEQETLRLKRANERLVRAGKEKVEKLDDLPEDMAEIDPFLDEAASITFDLVSTGMYASHSETK
ncbi:carboxy terminal-processing peptidase [Aliiglaciecola sp. 3_MG-2023]|uniref:carboxy terminal-processing peptidase n=1 Tax=Aliiglaciecola sp. 3_MG-2023 TaxID=3062644 RepID=UPI0026E28379|nr:carboxy terminal-processing peptidase [Aliiglaciecola sp. 3_MG-2023]MDO6692520.1 carboxy terminal-processing peptidase [Aliiglaciecola sp. 3_MG-2023]